MCGFDAVCWRNSVVPKFEGDEPCSYRQPRRWPTGFPWAIFKKENYVPYRLYGRIDYLPPGAATLGANISNTLGERSI